MAQFVVPAGDQATGSWSSTPLWSKIDETVASADGTTIASDNNTSPDNADFSTTNPEAPASGDHILRALWNKDSSGGHSINAVLELYQGDPASGGSLVATLSVTGIGATPQTDAYTLLSGEVDSISDYTGLFLRLSRQGDTGGNPNGRRSLVADAIELEIPDASTSQQFSQSLNATTSNTAGVQRKTSTTKDVAVSASAAIQRKTAVSRAATVNAAAGLTKKTTHGLSATATAAASLTTGLSFKQTVAATVSAVASLDAKVVITQALSATVSAVAGLSRKIGKAVGATTSTVVGLRKKTARTIGAGAEVVVGLTKKTAAALGATVGATADLSTSFTAGGNGGEDGGDPAGSVYAITDYTAGGADMARVRPTRATSDLVRQDIDE